MVFPSVPVYLDPPSWNQQQAQQPASGGGEVHQFPPGGAVPRPEGPTGGLIRPAGSMADRTRPAKFPQPETALKCPRCDSTNTKFCYFNNYSLSQPRHFCKTCRRYWTRGGALRNVPVGGGCRRNKRSKAGSGSSKSQATTVTDRQSGASSTSSTATSVVGGAIPHTVSPASQLPFMPSLYPLADYSLSNIGLNFAGIQSNDTADYHVGGSSSTGMEQWRFQPIQQFPFFGGLEVQAPAAPAMGFYPFDSEGGGVDGSGFTGQVHAKPSTSGLITQMASVKMEDNLLGLNLQRQYLGVPRNDQYWGGGGGGSSGGGGNNGSGWMTDLSSFNSSTSGNLL